MGKLQKYKEDIISKYLDGYSASQIAVFFNASKPGIISFLKKNNVKTRTQIEARRIRAQKENQKYEKIKTQICTICKISYDLNSDNFYLRSNKTRFHSECKSCNSKRNKEYKLKNQKRLKQKRKQNKEKISDYNKKYYQKNKEKIYKNKKKYRNKNKEIIKNKRNEYNKKKYNNDLNFKLRTAVSKSIRKMLKKTNSNKNNHSCLDYLPFTIKELKDHLESKFENWMNWGNWGVYNPDTWDDNDPSTWTWQIDHIIPHSIFKYQNLNDNSFKECWSLSNLRPLSSKRNILEGSSKKRHKK